MAAVVASSNSALRKTVCTSSSSSSVPIELDQSVAAWIASDGRLGLGAPDDGGGGWRRRSVAESASATPFKLLEGGVDRVGGADLVAVARIVLHVLGARLDGGLHHFVLRADGGRVDDLAPMRSNMKETEPVSPRAPPFLENSGAHIGGGAVAVVCQHFHDQADAAGAEALVADLLEVVGFAARRLLDGALDMASRGMDSARAHCSMARRRRALDGRVGPGRTCLAAMVMSRESLENSLERFLSCAPLRNWMFLNLEWPAMGVVVRWIAARCVAGGRRVRKRGNALGLAGVLRA